MMEAEVAAHGIELCELAGRGASGAVYRGRVRVPAANGAVGGSGWRQVAVKCVERSGDRGRLVAGRGVQVESARDAVNAKKALERLAEEIRHLASCRHRNIVRFQDFFDARRSDGAVQRVYIVTEWCELGDLAGYVGRHRLQRQLADARSWERTSMCLMRQLGAALNYLRAHDVVHMDIKPQNLLLSTSEDHKRSSGGSETIRPGGRASALALPLPAIGGIVLKLGDFGIAQLLKAGERGDRLIGTPLYMAPELVVHRRYDAKVDLWAFGAVLHELLYGFPPLHPAGSDQSIDAAVRRITEARRVSLPAVAAGIGVASPPVPPASAQTAALLNELLQLDPANRISFRDFFRHPLLQPPPLRLQGNTATDPDCADTAVGQDSEVDVGGDPVQQAASEAYQLIAEAREATEALRRHKGYGAVALQVDQSGDGEDCRPSEDKSPRKKGFFSFVGPWASGSTQGYKDDLEGLEAATAAWRAVSIAAKKAAERASQLQLLAMSDVSPPDGEGHSAETAALRKASAREFIEIAERIHRELELHHALVNGHNERLSAAEDLSAGGRHAARAEPPSAVAKRKHGGGAAGHRGAQSSPSGRTDAVGSPSAPRAQSETESSLLAAAAAQHGVDQSAPAGQLSQTADQARAASARAVRSDRAPIDELATLAAAAVGADREGRLAEALELYGQTVECGLRLSRGSSTGSSSAGSASSGGGAHSCRPQLERYMQRAEVLKTALERASRGSTDGNTAAAVSAENWEAQLEKLFAVEPEPDRATIEMMSEASRGPDGLRRFDAESAAAWFEERRQRERTHSVEAAVPSGTLYSRIVGAFSSWLPSGS